jgi:hypothetical protein
MFQRDFLLNEARKLAELLARLMGLKADGDHSAFEQQFNKALQDEYDASLEKILSLNENDFISLLQSSGYSVEKLNALGQLLYVFALPFNDTSETALILKKVLRIFDILEQKHNYYSFENIEKRKSIYNYYNKND